MSETNAHMVANFILSFSREHGDPLSNLKLQKLLYYAQAWNLAINGKPLFDERIEAWVHGPAVPSVYGAFKEWTWRPIMSDVVVPELPGHITAHLNEVMDVYGELTAYQLEKLTHSEAPWQNARKGLPPDQPSHNVIMLEDMTRFYRAVAERSNDDQAR